jgi:aldehyde dehydrogenase (NAD+)
LISRDRQDAFVEEMKKVAQAIVVGDPFDPATEMGPVANERQFERVLEYMEIGVAEGATLVTGGGRAVCQEGGFFVEPTIFSNVAREMRIAREEIFGPVICVMPFDSIEEAIEIANDTEFGLSGAVFTDKADEAYRIARKLRTGTVAQNGGKADFGIGFGGFKKSGIGREGGLQGIKSYLESKTVLLDSMPDHLG